MINIFIINGKGGSGKDTFVKLIQDNCSSPVFNYSTIDIIKKMAYNYGWDGKKDKKGRLLLYKLKDIWTWYNNLPYNSVYNRIEYDISKSNINNSFNAFIHCRESEGINAIKNHYKNSSFYEYNIYTILCKRNSINKKFGNVADDKVNNYNYDIEIDNNGSLDDLKKIAQNFIKTYIGE